MPRRAPSGFSLVETLIALAVLTVALLLALPLVLEQPRALRRIQAQRQATRAIEATLEALRAGEVPLAPMRLQGLALSAGEPAPPGLTLWIDTQPAGPPHLWAVTVRTRIDVLGHPLTREVETMIWSPP